MLMSNLVSVLFQGQEGGWGVSIWTFKIVNLVPTLVKPTTEDRYEIDPFFKSSSIELAQFFA